MKCLLDEFSTDFIHDEVKASLPVNAQPYTNINYIWLDELNSSHIEKELKKSKLAYTIEKEIFFWPCNPKYFVTDLGFVFTTGLLELNKENKDKSPYKWPELITTPWRKLMPKITKCKGYFVHYQTHELKGRKVRVIVDKPTGEHLQRLGFNVKPQRYRNYNFWLLSINKELFIDWCKSDQPPTLRKKKAGRGTAFSLSINGEVKTFENQKTCWEQLFADALNYEAFRKKVQRSKGKLKIGNVICEIV